MTYRAVGHVETTQAGGRAVLFNCSTGGATILNPTGSLLWARLTEPRTAQALADHLRERFPSVDPDTASRDTLAFLEHLLRSGLIEPVADPACDPQARPTPP